MKFSGKLTEEVVFRKEKEPRSALLKAGLKLREGCTLARYNDPGWTWSFIMEEKDENDSFVVLGLPTTIDLRRAQVPGFLATPTLKKHQKAVREIELASDGIVVNSYDDLEPLCYKSYKNTTEKKVWTIGPSSLSNRDVEDITARGNKDTIDDGRSMLQLA